MTRNVYAALGGSVEVPDVKGTLHAVLHGQGGEPGAVRRTDFVPGPDYSGMEDNDIRGFLDGTFLYGWNQVTQKYVRAGRLEDLWKYGEYEMFRILQRWGQLALPPEAVVEDVELRLRVGPHPPDSSRTLFLYAGSEDWDPGSGGVGRDNASPPGEGEVWWNDRGFGKDPWGLPGASSAQDIEPAPLASLTLEPGGDHVAFRSASLTRHVASRVQAGKPVLFMIKLQDRQEDIPGSIVYLWSASEGDRRNDGRKPCLSLFWRAPEQVILDQEVLLEHGRSLVFPVRSGSFVDFAPRAGSDPVELSARCEGGVWRPLKQRYAESGQSELRVRAVRDSIPLGADFTASFRDTWVRSAAPEDQDVPWFFRSPTGREVQVRARFEGDYTWCVDFLPDEVGRWEYWWRHDFHNPTYRSQVEVFDVVLETLEDASVALKRFRDSVSKEAFESREDRTRIMVRFSKLERDVMALLTPESFRDRVGRELVGVMREIRNSLGSSPVPDPIPLEAAGPPPAPDKP